MFVLKLWQLLILASALGAVAALISQFAATKKGIEAGAKATTLRENLDNLVERNTTRRNNLKERQKVYDEYVDLNIKHQPGQIDEKALKEAIKEENERIASLSEAIKKSEVAITETRTKLAEVEETKVLSGSLLAVLSVLIGAATAAIFGFLGVLGLQSDPISLTHDVPLTSSIVVQSLALGAGWPLVWEKFFGAEKLESAANAAASHFEITIKEAEKEQV